MTNLLIRLLHVRYFLSACALIVLIDNHAEAADQTSYVYDSLGRLISTSHSGGPVSGASTTFAYDKSGNRVSVITTTAPVGGNCSFDVLDAEGNSEFTFGVEVRRIGTCQSPVVINYSGSPFGDGQLNFLPQDTYKVINNPATGCGAYTYNVSIAVFSGNATIGRSSATVKVYDNC